MKEGLLSIMDKTMPTHTPQNNFNKKAILVMSVEKTLSLKMDRRLTILFLIIPKPRSLILSLGF